jgi:hypothetical protein
MHVAREVAFEQPYTSTLFLCGPEGPLVSPLVSLLPRRSTSRAWAISAVSRWNYLPVLSVHCGEGGNVGPPSVNFGAAQGT